MVVVVSGKNSSLLFEPHRILDPVSTNVGDDLSHVVPVAKRLDLYHYMITILIQWFSTVRYHTGTYYYQRPAVLLELHDSK